MKTPIFKASIPCFFLFAAARIACAGVNLVQDGNFTSVSYNGTAPSGITTLFGQFGTGTGSNLTVANWTTSGYNFVFAPGTADSGTKASGANSGQPNEAPGQYNGSNGFGNTYLYGPHNQAADGVTGATLPASSPLGGNFIAADGAYEVGALTQSISGLVKNQHYALTFYWGAVQQESFTGATTENWTVSLLDSKGNGQTYTTADTNLTATGQFSGWMLQTYYFTATATTETLSFLAAGTPSGEPPFSLLANVSLQVVPDFANWALFGGFGALCVVVETTRRRSRQGRQAFAPA